MPAWHTSRMVTSNGNGKPAKNGGKAANGKLTQFKPGNQGKLKGTKNKVTAEVKAIARGLLASEEYQTSLKARIRDGELPPAVETMLWYYSFGKPKETVDLGGGFRIVAVESMIREAEVLADDD